MAARGLPVFNSRLDFLPLQKLREADIPGRLPVDARRRCLPNAHARQQD